MVKVALLVGVSDYRPDLNSLLGAKTNVSTVKRALQHPNLGSFAELKTLVYFCNYEPDWKSLLGAQKDVSAMKRVLQHPDIGSFTELKTLLNPKPLAIQKAIETLFLDRQIDDLVLLYLSGQAVIDNSGKLYFVTGITRKDAQGQLVKSTVVSASLVDKLMSNSKSKQQVVILDCYFSGYFANSPEYVSVAIKNQLGAEGRVILTASSSTQYFFKHNESGCSNYTHYLVEGIETGGADLDNDGMISIGELHKYASTKAQRAAPAIEPVIYKVEESDNFWIAKAPIGNPQLTYRKAVEHYTRGGDISIISRSVLDELQESLGLPMEEATAIEDEVLKPYREYQRKLQHYADVFAETNQHKSINDEDRNALERFQQILGLTETDITPIEAQITSQTQKTQSPEQVVELPNAQIISGTAEAVSASKAEMHIGTALRVIPSTQQNPNTISNKSTQSDSVVDNTRAQWVSRAVLIAAVTLAGASYALHLWQDSQQLQKIKKLAEARNYEKCLTQAQAVTQGSSRYIDVQKFLKQCEAGVNWQKIQVRILSAHSGTVWSVAFSPNGETLASGSRDRTVKLWNVRSGKLLHTFLNHSGNVWSVAFSPDGETVASSSGDTTIKLWNVRSGKLLRILTAHSHSVWSVAFNPDGQILAAGSFDGTITVWHLGSGALLRTLDGYSGPDRAVTFSPDGQILTSGSKDQTIKLWHFRTGNLPRVLFGHTGRILAVAISPDGQTLVSGSEDKTIKLWNLGSGELLHTLTGHMGRVVSVAISPNGQTLVSASEDETIKIWNLQSGKLLRTFTDHVSPVISVAFSPDGRTFASGGQSGRIRLWQRY